MHAMSELEALQKTHRDIYDAIDPSTGLKDAAKGRNVLITGAGTGCGKAIAKAFAQVSAKTIVIVGRRLELLEKVKIEFEAEFSDCQVLARKADVSSPSDVENLFTDLTAQDIEINVLVNNAGVNLDYNSIRDSDPDQWWQNWEIMLKGPYLVTRAWLRARESSSKPAAVIMTSAVSSYLAGHKMSSYSSVKTALNRLTEFVHLEEHQNGVQAIAFHPGGVANTDITTHSPDWLQPYYTETAELGAGTAVYLSTPSATWLSGRYIDARWDIPTLETLRPKIEESDLLKLSVLGCSRTF